MKNTIVLKIIIAVLLVVVVILGVIAFNKGNNSPSEEPDYVSENTESIQGTEEATKEGTEEDTEKETEEATEKETGKDTVVNVKYDTETFVIFGVDSRENKLDAGTKSDSIMLVNLNHDLSQVRIVSILRDTMVEVDGYGYQKLNHGYYYGGPTLALDTINTNFDLDIKKYATFNFDSAGDIIDKLGGIEMEITADEAKYINSYIDEVNRVRGTSSKHITQAGTYTLDGTQAVAYSRIRYTTGGDLKRSDRQRTVLFKMFQKAKGLSTGERLEFAEEFMDRIKTNYSTDKMTNLLYCMSKYEIVVMDVFPKVFYDGLVGELWYEVPITLIDMNSSLHKVLLQEENYQPSKKVKEISAILESKVNGPNTDIR